MKKVRISKKDPKRILQKLQKLLDKPEPRSYAGEKVPHSQEYGINLGTVQQLQSDRHALTQRYRQSSERDDSSLGKLSLGSRRVQNMLPSKQKVGVRRSLRLSINEGKSPYLFRQKNNQVSNKYLTISSRKKTDGPSASREYRSPLRYNSLEHRSNSEQLTRRQEGIENIKEARKLMMAGEISKSIFLLRKILKTDPDNLEAQYTLCLNWFNLGDYERVLNACEQILESPAMSDQPHVHLLMIRSLLKAGHQERCWQKINRFIMRFPAEEQGHELKGNLHLAEGNHKRAITSYQHALELKRDNISLLEKMVNMSKAINQQETCLPFLDESIAVVSGHNRLKLQILKSHILIDLQRYLAVIEQFKRSDSPQLLYDVGLAYYRTGDLASAYLVLDSCLKPGEECTKHYKLTLLIKIKEKNFYEAVHLLERSSYLNIHQQEVETETLFINGVLDLIRRDIAEGVRKLSQLCHTHQLGHTHQHSLAETAVEIRKTISCYLAYGHYLMADDDNCILHYQTQLQEYGDIVDRGMRYNLKMSQALRLCSQQKYTEALSLFKDVMEMEPQKLEPYLCTGIVCINLGVLNKQEAAKQSQEYFETAKQNFSFCTQLVRKMSHNCSSNVYYLKSVLHGYFSEWREAVNCISQAIELSEENNWKHFYVRALLFACVHNFPEALHDCTVAINLNLKQPDAYLLRAQCLQIEGESNSAFRDLQHYIALRPNDLSIHKLAGKFLFENGAFEDAIKAFEDRPIAQTIQNLDCMFTKSKTLFLLGEFETSAQEMLKAYELVEDHEYIRIDAQMISLTGQMLDPSVDRRKVIDKISELETQLPKQLEKNQIFKLPQFHSFKAVCWFQEGDYDRAVTEFGKAIKAKKRTALQESLMEGSTREDERDQIIYLSQMRLNVGLCQLAQGHLAHALEHIQKIQINTSQSFYAPYKEFVELLQDSRGSPLEKEQQVLGVQIFPIRNKISLYLPDFQFDVHARKCYSRLCIPFPKVEPPEIFPQFDQKLINSLNAKQVERKPEAPWISKDQDAINFTGKIERYSRLQIQDSVSESNAECLEPNGSRASLQSVISSRATKNLLDGFERLKSKKQRR